MIVDASGSEVTSESGRPPANWIAGLPKLRDVLILIASVTYALGYAVWAIYALEYGLGTRPAVQMQYFVAGAPALVVLAAVGMAFYWAPFLLKGIRDMVVRKLDKRALRLLTMALLALIILSGAFGKILHLNEIVFSLILIVTQFMLMTIHGSTPPIRLILLLLTPIWAFSLYAYATTFYPHIAQELGGGRPKCVVIGLADASLNSASWQNLVRNSQLGALVNLKRVKNPSEPLRNLTRLQDAKVMALWKSTKPSDFAVSGPLLLWNETETSLLLSVGLSANWDDRFLMPRSSSMVVRYVSEFGAEGEGCPPID